MYILMWEFGSSYEEIYECKLFKEKHDLEDYVNARENNWLLDAKPRIFCGTESRIEELEIKSYVTEKKLRVLP